MKGKDAEMRALAYADSEPEDIPASFNFGRINNGPSKCLGS